MPRGIEVDVRLATELLRCSEMTRRANSGLVRCNTEASFDHLVGEQLHRAWHLDAKCLRGHHVDDQIEPARPHHREIRGLFALENAADKDSGLAIGSERIRAIAHEPAGYDESPPFINRWHRIAC